MPAAPLIAGNWKMNGVRAALAATVERLRPGLPGCDLVVCPPATLLAAAADHLAGSPVGVGGQDCHAEPSGAHTGDVSAGMLRDAGAAWVILGHSERRAGHHETDALVRRKTVAALAAGLCPIVCVGESEAQREAGDAVAVVTNQLAGSLPPDFAQSGFAAVVAYEPIWAIGTGRVPSRDDIAAMHHAIRAVVGPGVRILYGGSVKASNADVLLSVPDVDGALVGGASLDAAEFLAIGAAALSNRRGGL